MSQTSTAQADAGFLGSIVACIVACGALAVLSPIILAVAFWHAYLATYVWHWYLVGFMGAPELSLKVAFGIATVAGLLRERLTHEPTQPEPTLKQRAVAWVAQMFVAPLVATVLARLALWVLS